MLQPGLTDGLELALEPATDDIDRDAPRGELINSRQLLGGNRRRPRPGQYRGNNLELFGRGQ